VNLDLLTVWPPLQGGDLVSKDKDLGIVVAVVAHRKQPQQRERVST
jgi:hypothetical protein